MSVLLKVKDLRKDLEDDMLGTALEWGCEFKREEICELFLMNGSNDITPKVKARVIKRAYEKKNAALVQLFLLKLAGTYEHRKNIFDCALKERYTEVSNGFLNSFTAKQLGRNE